MLKKLSKFFLAILVLITVTITYLSFFGIKTNKFNNIINEKIKTINPELNLLLNDVYLKINIPQTSLIINTSNSSRLSFFWSLFCVDLLMLGSQGG